MKKYILPVAAALALTACAQVPLNKQTASGKPEGLYPSLSLDDVKSKLVEACNARSLMVYEDTQNAVVCGKDMDGASATMVQLAIGNGYSTNPVQKVRFSLSKSQAGVKVWADSWAETQMAMGQIRKMPIDNNKTKNGIQALLDSLQ
jgi:hypothetical protein